MGEELTVRLVGVAPLLMHSGRLADPLDKFSVALSKVTGKRAKTSADHARIAEIEWTGGLWLSGGVPCIPGEALEATAVAAAKAKRLGVLVRSGIMVRDSPPLDFDGPRELTTLYADKAFSYRCGVRVNNRRTMRTRPRFERWSVVATYSFIPSIVDRETLSDLLSLAGATVGLGDYRPRFGLFRVEAP